MVEIISVKPGNQEYVNHEWTILLFESPWCGNCKDLHKYLENFSWPDKIDGFIGTVDITENQPLAQQYQVLSLPTVIVLHKGAIKEKLTGRISGETLMSKIKKCIINQ